MACTTCSSTNTCTCTPVSSCESCVDILNAECVYYKGYYSNSLGLPANFRFNTFAETIIERVNQLPSDLIDTKLDDVTVYFASAANSVAKNTLKFIFDQTSPVADITKTVSIAKHLCFATINTGDVSVSTSETLLPITNVYNVEHAIDTNTIVVGGQSNKRTGYQEIYADLNFYTDTARVITVKLYEGSNVLKTAIVTTAAGTSTTNNYNVSLKTLYNYSSTGSTKNFSIKLDTDTNCTVSIVSGSFEVKEYEY